MRQKEAAIIVAGGKGLRLPGDIPKQFIEIGGLPVLMHTINAFRDYSQTLEILLVLPQDHFSRWESLCRTYQFSQKITIISGGSNRFQSVKNGLDSISAPGLVAVHDGVRPLVTPEIIAASFDMARLHRSAVASVPLKESIRELRDTGTNDVRAGEFSSELSFAVDRAKFRVMQTPQTFDIDLLKSAYDEAKGQEFTDDASVVELAGHNIALFDGSYENLKITTPVDLVVAEAIIQSRKQKPGKR
jgi:2-C-methyl-D-erythritol 4-phosphate cytidylyltransferase